MTLPVFISLCRTGVGLGALVALGCLAGCATSPHGTPPAAAAPAARATTTLPDPSTWVGRWQGEGARRVDIRSTPEPDTYALVFRNDQGVTVAHDAKDSDGRLFYEGGFQWLALRPGTGAETGNADMKNLAHCLITVPGDIGYCRRPDSADALALQHGTYVPVRESCSQAAPDQVLFFDGNRLYSIAGSRCTTRVVAQQGMIYQLANGCLGASGTARGINETVSTPDTHDLAVTLDGKSTQLYRYCATGLLPPNLRGLSPQ